MGKFCGSRNPKPVTTSGNEGLIYFRSDGNVDGEGFDLEWSVETVDDDVSGEDGNSGDVTGSDVSTDEAHCDSGWTEFNNRCYKLMKDKVSFTTANSRCNQIGANLASVRDEGENNFVKGLISKAPAKKVFLVWLGLHKDGKWKWTDGSPLSYINWAKGEPAETPLILSLKKEKCGGMFSKSGKGWLRRRKWEKGQWADGLCKSQHSSICSKNKRRGHGEDDEPESSSEKMTPGDDVSTEEAQQCRSGWSQYKSDCYKLMRDKVSWTKANSRCKQLGANLASIKDNAENNFIKGLIADAPAGTNPVVWFGLKKTEDGHWKWTDVSRVTYTNWAKGEPDNNMLKSFLKGEKCGGVYSKTVKHWIRLNQKSAGGQWTDIQCDKHHLYICKSPIDN